MKSEISDQFPLTTSIAGLGYFSRMDGMEVLCSIVPPEDIFPGSYLERELGVTFYPDFMEPIAPLSSALPVGIFDTSSKEVVAFAMNFHPEDIDDKYRIIPFHTPEPTLNMGHVDTYMFCNFRKPETLLTEAKEDPNPLSILLGDLVKMPFEEEISLFVFDRCVGGTARVKNGRMISYKFEVYIMLGSSAVNGVIDDTPFQITIPSNQMGKYRISIVPAQGILEIDNFHREQAAEIGDKIWKQLTELPF